MPLRGHGHRHLRILQVMSSWRRCYRHPSHHDLGQVRVQPGEAGLGLVGVPQELRLHERKLLVGGRSHGYDWLDAILFQFSFCLLVRANSYSPTVHQQMYHTG